MDKIIQEIDLLLRGLQEAEVGSDEMNDIYIGFKEKMDGWLHTCCHRNLAGTYIPSDLWEDLAQNFDMKVFISLHTYTPGTKAKSWLISVIISLTKDFLKTERHRKVTRQLDYECEDMLSEAYAKDRRLFRENYRCRPKKEVNKAPEESKDEYDELRELLRREFGIDESGDDPNLPPA